MSPSHKLSKDRIIKEAFDYVDTFGLETLSMRKLAELLNVKAMSLYNHISNKEDLISEIVDMLVYELHFQEKETWQETMKERARRMKDTLMNHSWATVPLVSGWNVKPNFLRFFDRSIGSLVQSGFSFGSSDQIISTLNSYVYGYVLQSLNFPIEETEYQKTAEEYKNLFDKNEHPYLWGLSNEIRLGQYSGITDFEQGLDHVIKGIEISYKEKEL